MRNFALTRLLSFLLLCIIAAAQERPPALLVPQDGKQRPMELAEMAVNVRIDGFLAETKTTMTFRNPTNEILAGTLYFPLPDGATVSGYALDIKGKMVEGVVVEKQKGRVVFEKIVRQGVDPGLVEWTQGNNFKTRVFPIPAKGARRVQVSYTSEIENDQYRLPLAPKTELEKLTLDIRVLRGRAKPHAVGGSLTKVEFLNWEQGFAANTTLTDVTLDKPLVIDLPPVGKRDVLVERAADGTCYFAVADQPEEPNVKTKPKTPEYVVIYWDASGSRADKHEKELAMLEALFGTDGTAWLANPKDPPAITVELFVIRNALAEPQRFTITPDSAGRIMTAIKELYYDGGTQLGAITPAAGKQPPDYYLLFSDGLSTFGKGAPTGFEAPVYTISADTEKNSHALRELALRTGGQFLNLTRLTPRQAAKQIGVTPFSFLGCKVVDDAARIYPSTPAPIQDQRFVLAGAFTGDLVKLRLSYGIGTRETTFRTVTLSRADAIEADLLRRYWAQRKLGELLIDQKTNRRAIIDLGKAYGLVTPYTSLIVLDSVEQYIEHEIQPPASLPEMRREYAAAMANRARKREEQTRKDLDRVQTLWEERVAWWDQTFKYPKDFKFHEREKREVMERADAAEVEAAPASAAPAAAAAPAEDDFAGGEDDGFGGGAASAELRDRTGLLAPSLAPKLKAEGRSVGAGIAIKKWDPKTPYLTALKAAPAERQLEEYLAQKRGYGRSPAFFLDCAGFFLDQTKPALALQVLSNIAELELENAALLRVLGHRLAQLGEQDLAVLTFEQVLRQRPEEPQSFRDLALVLSKRGELRSRLNPEAGRPDYVRAVGLLGKVVTQRWDRFDQIELIALTELNAIFARHLADTDVEFPIDERLRQPIPHDLRIVMTWDVDNTDIDLWVTEPSGEKVMYSHNRSRIGGRMSRDFTAGYGPEEYTLKKAMPGNYKIQANFYGSQSVELTGAVTIQVDIYTNYGRPVQKLRSITRRLQRQKEVIDLGTVEF